MSMELCFWKYKKNVPPSHKAVYERACCGGVELPVLEAMPTMEIRERVAAAFKDWNTSDGDTYEKTGHGAFSIFMTSQIVRFDCYDMKGDEMSRFLEIMKKYGCALYDTQTAELLEW